MDASLAIIKSNEDFKIIIKPYCKTCADRKLEGLCYYDISGQEVKTLVSYGVKMCRIKCECR